MDERTQKYLYDVISAVEETLSYFEERPKVFEVFCADMMLRPAVERNIEIMGEAMNRLLKDNPTIPITNARKIVDARNYIIHGYDRLSADILWSIVINHLPLLHDEVAQLLASK